MRCPVASTSAFSSSLSKRFLMLRITNISRPSRANCANVISSSAAAVLGQGVSVEDERARFFWAATDTNRSIAAAAASPRAMGSLVTLPHSM
jgi:hypothetical protein